MIAVGHVLRTGIWAYITSMVLAGIGTIPMSLMLLWFWELLDIHPYSEMFPAEVIWGAVIVFFIILPPTTWFFTKYSANIINKKYQTILQKNKLIRISLLYVGVSSLIFVLTDLRSFTHWDYPEMPLILGVSALTIMIFYLASKKYIIG